MIKIKTFIFTGSRDCSSSNIDETINNFLERENVKLINIKFATMPRVHGSDEIIYTLVYEA